MIDDFDGPTAHTLDVLFEVIQSRRGGDPEVSYTAKLFSKGRLKIAQKVGEEAVETVLAAAASGPQELVSESADLLFHLSVLWADCGVEPSDVWRELERRVGTSGIAEKNARPK